MTDMTSPWELEQRPRNPLSNLFAALQLAFFKRPKNGVSGRPIDVLLAIVLWFGTQTVLQSSYYTDPQISIWGLLSWCPN